MKLFLPLLAVLTGLFFPGSGLTAQAEATNWHFGQMRAVSFPPGGGTPLPTDPSAMLGFEGVVSQSDSTGQLLFYTNGGGFPGGTDPDGRRLPTGTIWNRNHEVLYDMGGTEGGGWSARQSSLAMPDPAGEPGVYYLFTMEESGYEDGGAVTTQPLGRGLSYFIIDMRLNGGLGGVRLADQRVYVPAYEGLDATPRTDAPGYWIVCHTNNGAGGDFIVTPLGAAGVGKPVVTPAPRPVLGRIKFSPDGRWLFNNGFVYPFDPATGLLGDPVADLPRIGKNTVSFTPDSRYLYAIEDDLTLGLLVVRYAVADEFARLPVARLETAGEGNVNQANGPIQIGPNDKLYFLEYAAPGVGGRPAFGLSEIDCASTASPTLNRFVVTFPDPGGPTDVRYNLPAYVDAIFARPFSPDTLRLDPTARVACAGEELRLTAPREGMTYRWSTGDTTAAVTVTTGGTYCVTVSGGCQPTVGCTEVDFRQSAVSIALEVLEDNCAGDSITARADITGPFDSLRWGNGAVTPSIRLAIAEAGAGVAVTVYGPCGVRRDSTEINVRSTPRYLPELVVSPAPVDVCPGDSLTLSVREAGAIATAAYRWFDGSSAPALTVAAEPDVAYTVSLTGECGEMAELAADLTFTTECDCRAMFPEVISPNGDGTNDIFRIFTNCTVADYTLLVYNRWGREVFTTTRAAGGWDGTRGGVPQEAGLHLYRAAFRFPDSPDVAVYEGQFTLVR